MIAIIHGQTPAYANYNDGIFLLSSNTLVMITAASARVMFSLGSKR
jgi:hypothetical protein